MWPPWIHDQASPFTDSPFSAILDPETGVMLRPEAHRSCTRPHCTYIPSYLYHRTVTYRLPDYLGLSRYLDT
jgi:hypothetical protein